MLAVTAEWAQRSSLTTFDGRSARGRIMRGKAIGLALVAVPATALAFAVGAGGNGVAAPGSPVAGSTMVAIEQR